MMMPLVLLSVALAQDARLPVRVALDDRALGRLTAPVLSIEQAGVNPASFSDDGSISGDVPADGILVATASALRTQTVRFSIIDDGVQLGVFEVALPAEGGATFQLKTAEGEPGVVLDLNAPAMPGLPDSLSPTSDAVLQALPSEQGELPGEGLTRLKLRVVASSPGELDNAQIETGSGESTRLSTEGDDGVYWGMIDIPRTELVTLHAQREDLDLGTVSVVLPATPRALVRLSVGEWGLTGEQTDASEEPLVVQAAPGGEDLGDADSIALTLYVDDRGVGRLTSPRAVIDQAGLSPTDLLDDGSLEDDTIDDGIFVGKLTVGRAEHLRFSLEDAGVAVGEMTVFLPSTSEASIRVRTTGDGLKLQTEPQALGGADGPMDGGGGGGGLGGTDRMAHVLWIGIALFCVAFAYTRRALEQRWTTEIKPLLSRLESWLDAQEKRDG
ncbi:MAG: hypothetical protein P8R54_10930 [Myxococcota bacterium]|nr:hypothetical protein [Myxococcota bacterium]